MPAGRKQKADPGSLYVFAHQFYWDFRRLAEGTSKLRYDRQKYDELTEGLDQMELIDEEDKLRHRQIVDEEIRTGRLEASRREERLRDIADSETVARRASYRQQASDEARIRIKIPGEQDVIETLLDPKATAEQIRQLCKESLMSVTFQGHEIEVPAWPIAVGSTFPTYLSQCADQYVAALRDPRFPRCDVADRPSTRLKQFWFLSRALAGALFGVKTRTAINLVGSMRPEKMFHEARYGKPVRRRRKANRDR